ncbi:sensor histidine kinase [Sphingomonas glacialis]|uniref:histidine kinase n=1 Tax=Sphingomonas glacialis TaxID=658225 RepID=A0A502FXX7_9SPHN|nr:sensor histidine kinase [Sphingomonas glacialis]TPG54344.1 sensor histidine kinase [Sphingomonas glacialis]
MPTAASIDTAAADSLMRAVIASSDTPLLLLDAHATILVASDSFCAAFAIDPAAAAQHALKDVGDGEWDVPQLAALLAATADGTAQVDAYEMALVRVGVARRDLVLKARKLDYADPANVRVLLAIADVTDARIAEQVKDDLVRDKAVLLKELQHRIANSLQIIASVLLQSAKRVGSDESRTHLRDAHSRVMSIAALQRQLAVAGDEEVGLRGYLGDLCRSIGASMIRDHAHIAISVEVDDSKTAAEVSVSLGLIVTELVINALKHAFPEPRGGTITVAYVADGADWTLSVRDDGIGMPGVTDPTSSGLGTTIVDALAKKLGAKVATADAGPGTIVSIIHAG